MSAETDQSARAAAFLATITAGAGQDNAQQTGDIIDRSLLQYPDMAAYVFDFITTLAETKTLTVKTLTVEHSDASDLSGSAVYATLADTLLATGATGGSTGLVGSKKVACWMGGCKRYVRLKYTPDLSNTTTDTAQVVVSAVFGPKKYV